MDKQTRSSMNKPVVSPEEVFSSHTKKLNKSKPNCHNFVKNLVL